MILDLQTPSRRTAVIRPPDLEAYHVRDSPPPGYLLISLFIHGIVVLGLALVPPSPDSPRRLNTRKLSPTEIRLGDRVYYVADIRPYIPPPPEPKAAPKLPVPVSPKSEPSSAPSSSAPAPKQPSEPDLDAKAGEPAPRAFIPPQIKTDLHSDATLIQPMTPPELTAQPTNLPSVRIFTAAVPLPKLYKPFVAPGRKKDKDQPQTPNVPAPDFDVAADTPTSAAQATPLISPLTIPSAPVAQYPVASQSAGPNGPAGDAVSIIAMNNHSVAIGDKIYVPAGSVSNGSGSGNGVAGSHGAGGFGAGKGGGGAGKGAGALSGTGGKGAGGAGVASNGARGAANGHGTGGTASSGTGTGPGSGEVVITRPANGGFDLVVTQTSTLDQFPEGKSFLSGRPIYSVYITVGTKRDWTLFFCVPGSRSQSPHSDSHVVDLAASDPPPVRAPFPTRMVRPRADVPSFFKYVLVHGYVTTAGRFDKLQVVKSSIDTADEAILAALQGWQFRGATRDGVPIAVEVLLSIPVLGL